MKIGLVASLLVHVVGLALVPNHEPTAAPPTAQSVAASCRCDYEMTITDTRPPRALTLGETPADRFAH